MRKIQQTVVGEKGNCMSACLASLFEYDLPEVWNFHDMADASGHKFDSIEYNEVWWEQVRRWLARVGYGITCVSIVPEQLFMLPGYLLVGGLSPRGHNHSVIWNSSLGGVIWDPHPQAVVDDIKIRREGVSPDTYNVGMLIDTWDMIYPLDPSRDIRRGRALDYITDRRWVANLEADAMRKWHREFADVCEKASM